MKVPDYAEMKNMLSFREAEDMTYRDIQEILLFGTKPYMEIPNDEIMDMFIETFGSHYIPKKKVKEVK
tara:strand:+ start:1516 stop:1719 length:204 start_codon:yes stop_codon:yes gene_type:complete